MDLIKWLDKDNEISFESILEHSLFSKKMNYDQIKEVYELLRSRLSIDEIYEKFKDLPGKR